MATRLTSRLSHGSKQREKIHDVTSRCPGNAREEPARIRVQLCGGRSESSGECRICEGVFCGDYYSATSVFVVGGGEFSLSPAPKTPSSVFEREATLWARKVRHFLRWCYCCLPSLLQGMMECEKGWNSGKGKRGGGQSDYRWLAKPTDDGRQQTPPVRLKPENPTTAPSFTLNTIILLQKDSELMCISQKNVDS